MANGFIDKTKEKFENDYTDTALSVMLIVAAIVIVLIALFVHNKAIKALALAYVILP